MTLTKGLTFGLKNAKILDGIFFWRCWFIEIVCPECNIELSVTEPYLDRELKRNCVSCKKDFIIPVTKKISIK